MFSRVEVPFPPRPSEPRDTRIAPPWVPIEPRWEYKELTRDLATEAPPNEAELNALGMEHWELAGVVQEGQQVHFYFKRERAR
jgi:hypothetical protein